MAQLTHWADPSKTYQHRTQGKKTNYDFCKEVEDSVNRDPNRRAIIKRNSQGHIAVFTEKFAIQID